MEVLRPARILLVALPLLVGALTFAVQPVVADLGVETAYAKKKGKGKKGKGKKGKGKGDNADAPSSCADANTEPQDLTVEGAQQAIACLLDIERDQHGLPDFATNGNLTAAAQKHTDYMLQKGCFAHECPGELGMVLRIKTTGYLDGVLSWSVGENIAWGEGSVGTPASIVKAWMNSSGHRANILNPDFDDVGIGVAIGSPSNAGDTSAATYTTDFGYSHG